MLHKFTATTLGVILSIIPVAAQTKAIDTLHRAQLDALGATSFNTEEKQSASEAAPAAVRLYGVSFGPYVNGKNPNVNPLVTASEIRSLLTTIAPNVLWVRSFSMTNGLENLPAIARSLGLKVAAGVWIGKDLAANDAEIQSLISAANAGLVDLVIVGSEVLLRGDVSEANLVSYITQVRQAISSTIPVARQKLTIGF